MHRRVPLPAAGTCAVWLLFCGDEPITNEYAVHRSRRQRRHPLERLLHGDLVGDAPGAPPRMLAD